VPATLRVQRRDERRRSAPAYIVSFAALMTILLTFFILMCAMANEQECGLVGAGTGSFIHNINAFGLPGFLPGQRTAVDLGEGRPQFAMTARAVEESGGSDADILYRRVISIEPIRLPRALAKYFQKKEALYIPLRVEFPPGEARLDRAGREYLRPLLERIRTVPYHLRVEAHVSKEFIFNQKYSSPWQLSAARAAAVVRYFHHEGGISYRRMQPVGHGSAKPLVNSSVAGSANDRIQLVILKH